ncbi:phage tail sheath subtilisin-like domain-containing protein [Citrobacter portucalensis]|uniref:phage tail sheath subtilisin-like domain-containing protein n=1 Tax=Citrobacter portucalensis TaxID=1639133 RepID=UPI00226B0A0D|nr:phage tail sheath subtilisin-like domain-containing protein [Citrobacter portucalensis]MCX9038764.1 phage tail sheath subtilisin-like domain-containing protein [Citrobacter portucalensis]
MSSPNVEFYEIGSSIRKPGKYFEFNTRLAVRTLPGNLQRVLMMTPILTTGTAQHLQVLDIYSDEQAAVYFGRGSLGHLMATAAIKSNPYLSLQMIGTRGSQIQTPATCKITLTGPATGAGEVKVTINGTDITSPVADAATAQATATAVAAAITASAAAPVTATAQNAIVTLTAKQAGAAGNAITVVANSTAADMTATATAMAGGGSNIAEPAGVTAAAGSVTITGPATGNGALSIWIGDVRLDVAITSGDTADAIATGLMSAVAAYPNIPVTVASAQGVITFTARTKGDAGNDLSLRAATGAAGTTVAVTPMSGGTGAYDFAPVLAAAFSGGHNIVVSPYSDQASLTTLRSHLTNVSGPMEQRGAIGVAGWKKSLSTATSLAEQLNEGRITIGWHNGSVKLPCEIAAAYAAVIASEEDPARPLNTLSMDALDVTDQMYWPGRTEQENALHNGVTPFEIGPGNKVQIVRAVTTYTRNAEGVDDVALLDLTTIRTLDYVRKSCRERISLRFPRDKLSTRTPPKVESELLDVLLKLEELEIVENVMANRSGLLAEKDSQDANRLNARIPSDVVNGLHVFAGRIDLYL